MASKSNCNSVGQFLMIASFSQEIFAENLGYLQESIAILQVEPGEKEKLTGELEKLSQLLEDASEE